MYKKTLLSLAIASTLTLTGCLENDKNEDENIGADANGLTQEQKDDLVTAAGTYPIFNPAISAIPIPNDLIFDKVAGDGTFSVPDTAPPVTTAINSLSGASTTAPIDIAMSSLIDSSTLNSKAYDDVGLGLNINPLQNVFLLELDYASGSPLQGLSAQEPPTIIPPSAGAIDYIASEILLNGTSYIRINPTTPLKPNTRYVVAITNEIKDATVDNAPIQASPSYKHITGSDPLLADSLAPVRALTNGLWEAIAVKYFDLATNQLRTHPAVDLPALTADNIALSYSFTTSGDEKVLNYIADPAQWFNDQITTFVGVKTATAVVTGQLDVAKKDGDNIVPGPDGNVDHSDVSLSVAGALAAFPANPSDPTDTTISDALAPISAAFAHPSLASTGCATVTAGPNYISCVGIVLASFPSTAGGFADLLPTPPSSTPTINNAATLDLTAVIGNPNSLGIPAGLVNVVSGDITIPYYSGLPTHPTLGPAAVKYTNWEADDTLATAINSVFGALGLSIPQADPTVSKAVNYIFPFPKKQSDVQIPILALYPAAPAGPMKTLIWQHGITGNRSNVLGFGSALVANAKLAASDVAVIAIDIPLHGLDDSTNPVFAFDTTFERHFDLQEAGPRLIPEAIDLSGPGGSGSMVINLENFLTSRDNLRQHVVDLLSLRKSLVNIDFNPTSGDVSDLNSADVYYAGHSLGTVTGQPFVAVANNSATPTDDIAAASFFTPGGGIVRFLENSPAFAPAIVSGLAASGFTFDTSNYQAYLNVFQAALDSVDPINFVQDYVTQTTPVHFVEAVGDTVIPNSNDTEAETLSLTLGNGVVINGSVSHLSGTEPLIVETGATTLTTAGTKVLSELTSPQVITRIQSSSANHGTPSSGSPADGFAEILSETASLIISGGTAVTVTNDAILQP